MKDEQKNANILNKNFISLSVIISSESGER